MSELEEGDKVKVLHAWKREGDEGVIEYTFCEYGDHRVCVMFEDGDRLELDEGNVEYLGPDKYEYSVQFQCGDSAHGGWMSILDHDWMTKKSAEGWLSNYEAANKVMIRNSQQEFSAARLVKRRKAGKVEQV